MEFLYKTLGKQTCLVGWDEFRQLLFDYLPSRVVRSHKQVRCHFYINLAFCHVFRCPQLPLPSSMSYFGLGYDATWSMHTCNSHSKDVLLHLGSLYLHTGRTKVLSEGAGCHSYMDQGQIAFWQRFSLQCCFFILTLAFVIAML